MAEVITVVAVVSSIVQLVDFTSKVVARLNDIQLGTKDIPKSLQHLKTELPILFYTLQQLHDAIKADRFPPKCASALQPAIDGCNQSVQEIESILSKTLPEQSDGRTKNSIKSVGSVWHEGKIERITATLRGCIATLTFYFAASSSMQQTIMYEKVSAIQKWLPAPDPSENYFKALRLREPNTGLWLLESDIYKDWKSTPSFVWLHGIPGCGKTVLSTTVLEDIRKYTADEPGKATIYFYFDFNDRRKQSPEMMARSLLLQLLQQYIEILPTVEGFFESSRRGQPLPSLETVLEVLKELLVKFPCTYLVLDALDECDDREELMKIINTISSWNVQGLHMIFTSRREGDITATLERMIDAVNILNIQTKAVDRDIQLYVHRRIADEPTLQKWKEDDKQLIEQSLAGRARGMFRLAACRLDVLRKCRNRKQLLHAIGNLPPDLDEMYNRILGQIEKEDVPYAIRILRWLAFASRPLYLREVAEVAALDSDRKPAFDRDEVLQDPSEVLTICSSLVTVVHIYNTGDFGEQYQSDDHSNIDSSIELEVNSGYMVLLAHYSVKEYLVSKRILESKANLYGIDSTLCHQILAKSCLLYLFQLNMSDLPRYSVLRDSELVTYSAEAWIYHYKLIQTPDPELNELVVELFRAKGTFPNMIAFSNMTRLSTGKTVMWWQHAGKLPKSVFIACELGLLHVVQRLVSETSVDINEPTNNAMTLLEIAARSGYLSLVELLLERGALTKDDALVSACIEGHLEVVRLLVEQGAQVNAQDKRRFSSLYWASASGHLSIVQYLIERGADIKTPDETALYIASSHGHLDIVRVLVENGADINALDGRHPGALCGASYGGHVEIVEYLVKNGADVNANSREGENALALASAKGNFDVVQYLIENGAEADTQEDDRYGNPLEEAARRLRLNILEHWGGSEEVGGDIIDGPRR